jgi:hypothetical protein
MPRLRQIQTNFTAGELTPRVQGRVDIARYQNGAEIIENAYPVVHGGAVRRPGTVYVAPTKFANKKSRLIRFVFSTSTAYVLEFGDLYMRVFTQNAQVLSAPSVPYEIVSPYTEAMLPDLEFSGASDTIFITHPSVTPYRLRRFGDASWDLQAAPFIVQPFDEIGDSFTASLTLGSASVGTGIACTASAGTFLAADVGRAIVYRGSTALITGFTSATVVTVSITAAFPSTAVPASQWTLTGSPQTTLTPTDKEPLEKSTTLTAAANAFRTTDVGKFVRINDGLLQITAFTTALAVTATIKEVLTAAAAAQANGWTLEASVWNAANGYPRAVVLHEQRLLLGGSTAFPQTVWGSAIGAYLDFTLGSFDDDGFAYTLASDEINPIVHLGVSSALIVMTYGSEFTMFGGVEKPITPTNVQVKPRSSLGANNVRPVRVGDELLMVQRSGVALNAVSYNEDTGVYSSPEISTLSEHLMKPAIVDLAFQQKPDPLAYAVRSDGVMPTMTISREQDIIGWARQTTDGTFESVASIPVSGGDQTWVIVKRTVNGATVRYVEYLDSTVNVDCCIKGTSVGGANVWSGLTHLQGKTVQCIADGRYMGTFTVTAGTITLPRNAKAVAIGLQYISRIKLLTPEVQGGEGTAQGAAMSTSEVTVSFLETVGCKVNGNDIAFREFGTSLLDQSATPFTGVKKIENLQWDDGKSDIELSQDLPFNWHIRSVTRVLTVNSG